MLHNTVLSKLSPPVTSLPVRGSGDFERAIHAFLSSRLDHCDSLYKIVVHRLQHVYRLALANGTILSPILAPSEFYN